MGSTSLENRERGGNKKLLTNQQRAFVFELLADDKFDGAAAARKCGYKNPANAAVRLLKNKRVAAILGKAQRERQERCKLEGDDVLMFLRDVLYLNPLDYFFPTEDGWNIKCLETLPPEVGRLIEGMKIDVTEKPDGTIESSFEVKLISKTAALGLAMRHTTVDKVEVKHTWDRFLENKNKDIIDVVETRLIEEGA